MEKGKRDREHRDTGHQRSEPEEWKHARQPEGRAEENSGMAKALESCRHTTIRGDYCSSGSACLDLCLPR